ncbi:hypothetical protein EX30DRAFT_193419 [Ascodesmis nigricans]|uniref:Uncharacterized protein n=1 Tax=Ascodesmis nigricans TaxID=341454 RepID=A0A4S2N0S4_9PEZI|nr:hypothetical protein EX30DRAFT_193419 [Ascodesmis nigricans]
MVMQSFVSPHAVVVTTHLVHHELPRPHIDALHSRLHHSPPPSSRSLLSPQPHPPHNSIPPYILATYRHPEPNPHPHWDNRRTATHNSFTIPRRLTISDFFGSQTVDINESTLELARCSIRRKEESVLVSAVTVSKMLVPVPVLVREPLGKPHSEAAHWHCSRSRFPLSPSHSISSAESPATATDTDTYSSPHRHT